VQCEASDPPAYILNLGGERQFPIAGYGSFFLFLRRSCAACRARLTTDHWPLTTVHSSRPFAKSSMAMDDSSTPLAQSFVAFADSSIPVADSSVPVADSSMLMDDESTGPDQSSIAPDESVMGFHHSWRGKAIPRSKPGLRFLFLRRSRAAYCKPHQAIREWPATTPVIKRLAADFKRLLGGRIHSSPETLTGGTQLPSSKPYISYSIA
jgi:hypothetical protein